MGVGLDLLLTEDIEQIVKLCEIISSSITKQVAAVVGQGICQKIIDKVGLAEFQATEFKSPEEALSSFQKLLSELNTAITDTLGKERAKFIIEDS